MVVYYRRDGTPMLPAGRRHPDALSDRSRLVDESDVDELTRLAPARVAALRSAA
jgi:hypothetical protein